MNKDSRNYKLKKITPPTLKIKLDLDSQQFKSEGIDVEKVAVSGGAAFDSFSARVTAFSFAYSQVTPCWLISMLANHFNEAEQ